MHSNLGYRGLIIRAPGIGTVRLQNGLIEISDGEGVTYRCDDDRKLERWLLHSGRSMIDPEIHDLVIQQISG